ncbi:MAG: 1-acyl-sn-glycerol-3-phosphate acyltransferase [Deltaproteobacteria bacterium]|nr:1-acyl-sn-glycerol-3-phosphate acyltransferase [Deltaproteobacteria bacterium]
MDNFSKKPFYPFVLEHKPGFFLAWLLYRLFKRVHFEKNITEKLKNFHREGTVVYAIKYRGHLDYLLYHFRFRKSRLPYPKIAFDMNMSMFLPLPQLFRVIRYYLAYFLEHKELPNPFKTGFFRDEIKNGTTSLLCLVDPKGFAKQFIHEEKDYLQFLLEIQKEMEKPIYIVPQLVLYKKTPEKEYTNLLDIFFGFKEKPGFIRKIVMFFRYNRRAFIDFGSPVNLKSYLKEQPSDASPEDIASNLKQVLIDSIDTQKRIILGPVMKSRQQLKEIVLRDGDLAADISQMAGDDLKRLKQIRKTAGEYFDEIAADYNIAYIQFFHMALKWLWKKIFQGIEVNPSELSVVREWARKAPVVYIPSHKSHIDYLILNYILYENHMHIPRIAAGNNLAFWPMGHIFRKSGAFFIRRSFKGAKLYSKVFAKYIKVLLEEKHPLEFFIEGGRSRSGKLTLPKIGFLSILLQAYHEGYCNDLVFVPASISYDWILEEKSYVKELGGESKTKENFKQILKSRHFLKRKYGKVYIRFNEPLSLKEYLSQNSAGDGEAHRRLAFDLIRSINSVTLVTPLALTASAILTKHRQGFYIRELISTAGFLFKFIERHGFPRAMSLNNFDKTIEETLLILVNKKVVNLLNDINGDESFYYIDEEKMPQLEYYKNSIIHCFIPHAFIAVSLLTGTEEITPHNAIADDYIFLRNLFRYEFIYDEELDVNKAINTVISDFTEISLIRKSDGGYSLTKLGFDMLPVWAAMAKTYIESYWIAVRSLIGTKDSPKHKGAILKDMVSQGIKFRKMGLIDHIEAVSQVNFSNAYRSINKEVLKDSNEADSKTGHSKTKLSELSNSLYNLSHYRK